MGNFYTNITLKGPAQSQIADAMKAAHRTSLISPTTTDYTVIYDEQAESQDRSHETLAQSLSAHFHCTALAVLNHDDDILTYILFENGKKTDAYNSCPDYFGEAESEDEMNAVGNAETLCKAFGRPQRVAFISEALIRGSGDYVFELDRHTAIVDALGLPSYSAGIGYNYLKNGTTPEGLSLDQCVRT